jgi:hypothetical protein
MWWPARFDSSAAQDLDCSPPQRGRRPAAVGLVVAAHPVTTITRSRAGTTKARWPPLPQQAAQAIPRPEPCSPFVVVLVEEKGSTRMADNDGDSGGDRMLGPLQAAATATASSSAPGAGQSVLTAQGVAQGCEPLATSLRRHRLLQRAHRPALRRRRPPGAGATVPPHRTPRIGQRAPTDPGRQVRSAEARALLA